MDSHLVSLCGTRVHLIPLSLDHVPALAKVGCDASLWEHIPFPVRNETEMHDYVEEALKARDAGIAIPFATVELMSGIIVGTTRFGNMDMKNRRVEIGWTWVAPAWQRTVINTEAKYLMLVHAFDTLGCNRVEFKTDALNSRSRKAIERLGAQEEGTLRRHMVTATSRLRDTVYYSIIREEWPAVRSRFEKLLLPRQA